MRRAEEPQARVTAMLNYLILPQSKMVLFIATKNSVHTFLYAKAYTRASIALYVKFMFSVLQGSVPDIAGDTNTDYKHKDETLSRLMLYKEETKITVTKVVFWAVAPCWP
jgi:hypothetical protein